VIDRHATLRSAIEVALYEALFEKGLPSVGDIPKHLSFDWGIPIKPKGEGTAEVMVSITGKFDLKVVPRHRKSGEIADMVRGMIERGDA
jgi:hypothetical protein